MHVCALRHHPQSRTIIVKVSQARHPAAFSSSISRSPDQDGSEWVTYTASMDQAMLVSALLFSLLIYLFALPVYRIYFSPVSHVPGPLIAKATFW